MTIQQGQDYTIARFGSEFYILDSLAPEDAEVAGADEIIRAKSDYTFEVENDELNTVMDQHNNLYDKVIDSKFKVDFIAQLPPFVQL